ncbi:MAG TPA: hypothetical protein VLB27_12060, partial [candidate division Zixibacteria bacterium]|nr:hypothetical protein [candidate division Zixibacteria bacterium]
PQWHHALTLTWRSDGDPDSMGSAWFIQGHAEHVADYMRWQQQTRAAETDSSGVPLSEDTVLVRPESDDVKLVGATVGALARLGAGFMIWSNYTLKYAVDADENKLAGYYPHKAAAVLSYVRPHVTWGIGLRANIAAVYWYSDRRIAPTIYTEPHVFRVDLSGTATLNSFQFNVLVQNLFNFAYRTRAEYPLTGRTLRVGFEWHFLD